MRLACLSWHALLLALALTASCAADPLESTAAEPVLRDPSPTDSHAFPPGLATSGAADPGHERSSVPPPARNDCSALSPCAVPPPAQAETQRRPSG